MMKSIFNTGNTQKRSQFKSRSFGLWPWRWRQHGPPKHWYPTTTLQAVTIQNTWNSVFSAVNTSNLAFQSKSS